MPRRDYTPLISRRKKPAVRPCEDFDGQMKQGELTSITPREIGRILGFSPQHQRFGRVNQKASGWWTFELEDEKGSWHKCAIWDYYSTSQWFSTYGPKELLKRLFGKNYEHGEFGTSNPNP